MLAWLNKEWNKENVLNKHMKENKRKGCAKIRHVWTTKEGKTQHGKVTHPF